MELEAVLVSSWRRADYLQVCLDALLHTRGIEDREVWIFQNNRYDKGIDLTDVHRVIKYYSKLFPHFQVTNQEFRDRNVPGWWYAQQDMFKTAYRANAPKIYFFSDDTICTRDFFEWHEEVNKEGLWFCSNPWRPAEGNTKPYCLQSYYMMRFPGEISNGPCFTHDNLGKMLDDCKGWPSQEHLVNKQLKIPVPYVQRVYHIGSLSSHLESVGENRGPAVDVLPNPIPDYGRQKMVFRE